MRGSRTILKHRPVSHVSLSRRIFADLAIQYPGGVSMLHQGNASVIRAGMGDITLVPDGLAHVLAIEIH